MTTAGIFNIFFGMLHHLGPCRHLTSHFMYNQTVVFSFPAKKGYLYHQNTIHEVHTILLAKRLKAPVVCYLLTQLYSRLAQIPHAEKKNKSKSNTVYSKLQGIRMRFDVVKRDKCDCTVPPIS